MRYNSACSYAASSGPSLNPNLFLEPELVLFSVFARDLAADVYGSCEVCAARMLPYTPAAPSVYVCPWAFGQRPRGGDYLVEQEQRAMKNTAVMIILSSPLP
jgi:hypothetical protein